MRTYSKFAESTTAVIASWPLFQFKMFRSDHLSSFQIKQVQTPTIALLWVRAWPVSQETEVHVKHKQDIQFQQSVWKMLGMLSGPS